MYKKNIPLPDNFEKNVYNKGSGQFSGKISVESL